MMFAVINGEIGQLTVSEQTSERTVFGEWVLLTHYRDVRVTCEKCGESREYRVYLDTRLNHGLCPKMLGWISTHVC